MTNKLLLRFYHKDEKKMYYDVQECQSEHVILGMFGPYLLCTSHQTHRVFHPTEGVVMRAIGRTDMHGKNIYERDCLRFHKEGGAVAEVITVGHIFGLEDKDGYFKDLPIKKGEKIEIIGNTLEEE